MKNRAYVAEVELHNTCANTDTVTTWARDREAAIRKIKSEIGGKIVRLAALKPGITRRHWKAG